MKKFLLLFTAWVFTAVAVAPSLYHPKVEAVSGSSWRAGNMISDPIFTNKSSMTVSQIQTFLNSKMPSCDTDGSEPSEYGGGTRADYGRANGNPPPFTCLKSYWEVPKTKPSSTVPKSNYGGKPRPTGSRSAARLIYDAAQAYNISPKVLLVTLQKEQSLLTDEWPFKRQFLYAMGAHCPDGPAGAQCDPNYSGFSLQMREGAELFRYYIDNMTKSWWPYKKPFKDNSILWQDPNIQNCGSKTVYIQSKATAALYTYTPYQPNSAALANLYGSGDMADPDPPNCSSFGNRNFWRIFHDWFGSPYKTPNYRLISCGGQKYLIERFKPTKRLLTDDAVAAWKFEESEFNSNSGCGYPTYASSLDRVARSRNTGKVYLFDNGRAYRLQSLSISRAWGMEDEYKSSQTPQLDGDTIKALLVIDKTPRLAKSSSTSKVYLMNGGKINYVIGTNDNTDLTNLSLIRGYGVVPMATFTSGLLSDIKAENGEGGSLGAGFKVGSEHYLFDHGKIRWVKPSYYPNRWEYINEVGGPTLSSDILAVMENAEGLGPGFKRDSKYYFVSGGGNILVSTSVTQARKWGVNTAPIITNLLRSKLLTP